MVPRPLGSVTDFPVLVEPYPSIVVVSFVSSNLNTCVSRGGANTLKTFTFLSSLSSCLEELLFSLGVRRQSGSFGFKVPYPILEVTFWSSRVWV